jgi:hypothetical protein
MRATHYAVKYRCGRSYPVDDNNDLPPPYPGPPESSRAELEETTVENQNASSRRFRIFRDHPIRSTVVVCTGIIILSISIACIVVLSNNRNSLETIVTTHVMTTSETTTTITSSSKARCFLFKTLPCSQNYKNIILKVWIWFNYGTRGDNNQSFLRDIPRKYQSFSYIEKDDGV